MLVKMIIGLIVVYVVVVILQGFGVNLPVWAPSNSLNGLEKILQAYSH